MNLASVLCLLLLVGLICFGSRRSAVVGLMAGAVLLPGSNVVSILDFNIFPLRFLEAAAFTRVMLRNEVALSRFSNLDKAFVFFYFYKTLVFILRGSGGYTYEIGLLVDAFLLYFSFRGLVQTLDEFHAFLRTFAIILMLFFLVVLIQRLTTRNLFEFIGLRGQALEFREGIPRLAGTFRHPILMGSFGAIFMPLYIGLFFEGENRQRSVMGILSCGGIIFLSNSGGPLSSAVVGIIGWVAWVFRNKMNAVRIGIGIALVFLIAYMKAPIWYLPAKISQLTGGGGWHRSHLLDMAIKDLHKWWLAGIDIRETAHWFPYTLGIHGGADITNQFVAFGISAGIGAIFLFIYILILSYKNVGEALVVVRCGSKEDRRKEFIVWGLGVAITVHISNWFGVPYFDQTITGWLMHLAVISSFSDGKLFGCDRLNGA